MGKTENEAKFQWSALIQKSLPLSVSFVTIGLWEGLVLLDQGVVTYAKSGSYSALIMWPLQQEWEPINVVGCGLILH